MSYEPNFSNTATAKVTSSSQKIVYVLVGLIAAVLLYKYSISNESNSAKPIVTQASRWQATRNGGSQFANANAKSKVVNFDPTNPFMGDIKNGIMIDGTRNF